MNSDRLATLISVLGVVLTTASVIASVAQYRAADLQAQAAVVALMPQIEVRTLLEKTDGEKYSDRRIQITSDGGPIYNFEVDRLTWFELRVGAKVIIQQPLSGYYFTEYPTGRTKGEVSVIGGHKNHQAFLNFARWARDILGSGVDMSEPNTLLRISYRDALKHDSVEFVKVVGGSQFYLSQDDGLKLWQQQTENQKVNRGVDMDSLTDAKAADEWLSVWKRRAGLVR
jgi:hypothetical protein